MAWGLDSAAHAGALAAASRGPAESGNEAAVVELPPTVAVLPGAPQHPYPARNRALHRRIVTSGLALSELGPETAVRPWMFVARNRVIAALAAMTVVVEAPASSGALGTATWARTLEREVGAVPGQVTSPRAAGANALLHDGAVLVRDGGDVLTALCRPLTAAASAVSAAGAGLGAAREGVGAATATVRAAAATARAAAWVSAAAAAGAGAGAPGRQPPGELQAAILDAIAAGAYTADAIVLPGTDETRILAEIAALELDGWLRRGAGGKLTLVP
jgi:DNA processing protein